MGHPITGTPSRLRIALRHLVLSRAAPNLLGQQHRLSLSSVSHKSIRQGVLHDQGGGDVKLCSQSHLDSGGLSASFQSLRVIPSLSVRGGDPPSMEEAIE